MRKIESYDGRQPELGLGLVYRKAVESLRRFKAVRWLVNGEARGGELMEVSYSDWLAFYTPLCSRGQEGGCL